MPPDTETPPPDFSRLRLEYSQRSLSEHEVDPNPVRQFLLWLHEAIAAGAHEPNAMTLATCTRDGIPSARIVLLKGVDQTGFAFFTNYLSHKGRELDRNPQAALVFYWPELERQVRVEGEVVRTPAEESDMYFQNRPRESQIGSAASPQSEPVPSREYLEELGQALRSRYPVGDIPRPAHWGGYRVRPKRIEFWQGRVSRVHDRVEYELDDALKWNVRRLAP